MLSIIVLLLLKVWIIFQNIWTLRSLQNHTGNFITYSAIRGRKGQKLYKKVTTILIVFWEFSFLFYLEAGNAR